MSSSLQVATVIFRAPLVALISKRLAPVEQFTYAALINFYVHRLSVFDVVFWILIEPLLAICRAEDIGFALIAAPEFGVIVHIHFTYEIFNFFT